MRLSSLAPKWVTPHNWTGADFYIGVTYDWPVHNLCPTCGRGEHRLAVMFYPPIDTANAAAQYGGEDWLKPWESGAHRRTSGTGDADDFDSLTLAPSVEVRGHWHGTITNGEVTLV